ncbi:MAG: hypothetical protein Q7R32_08385 [Dehalococcoidia bacterium]|nr:hypothetical protein [Dehalococcoidia bacterium]
MLYVGLPRRRAGERRRLFAALRDDPRAIVAFESPHRLRASLTALLDALGMGITFVLASLL